jgi:5-formyltetrahydrofolate cyclo-ligase
LLYLINNKGEHTLNGKAKSPKDIWDKLDILSKIVSGIVLVLIAIVLKFGADKISSSLQTGQLVQSLISDLSSPDTTKIRQEIALVALDQTLWNQNKELVLQVCERILLDTKYENITGSLAFKILKSRAPVRAGVLEKRIEQIIEDKLRTHTTPPDSSDDLVNEVQQDVPDYNIEGSNILARVKKNKLYIHFANEENRQRIRQLQRDLKLAGFYAPGIENVKGNYKLDIRYFHKEDSILTGSIVQIIKNFLDGEGINIKSVSIKNFRGTKYQTDATVGLVEIWINLLRLKE